MVETSPTAENLDEKTGIRRRKEIPGVCRPGSRRDETTMTNDIEKTNIRVRRREKLRKARIRTEITKGLVVDLTG